ncbi:DUF4351 domain-containing protein [Ancylothrix sp. C2]|uniref:DUF4351 domain-containing protein n=1 Tax=Ancylothrix sp. D3o TaxID=2953691 RepID=UPI0021BB9489|nr:DUF4351 domain-containing protein [Ancylothrix sp. D3o]MCT7951430.1 DUF4351 domain-containing protein [Ancylothrix sp. D3o]
MAEADISSKRLISLNPDGWAQWVTQRPDIKAGELIDPQFQWVSRESDIIIKATGPEIGEFLILNEIQLRYKTRMPKRMRAYAALAEEKYNLPVYPVLINILPPTPETPIPNRYESNFLGLQATQEYRVINLWEVEAEIAFQPSLKALLPLVPVMKGGNNETTFRQAVQIFQADNQSQDLLSILAIFATFVYTPQFIQQLMNLAMEALQESPLGKTIAQQAEQRGLQQGQVEGKKQEAQRYLLRLLNRRFGAIPAPIQTQIQNLTVEQLEELGEILLTANSLEEFSAAIPSPENP